MQQYISSNNNTNKLLRVTTKDGRALFGLLICSDKDCNFILQDATEVRQEQNLRRYIGMVVVPGEQIESIALQN